MAIRYCCRQCCTWISRTCLSCVTETLYPVKSSSHFPLPYPDSYLYSAYPCLPVIFMPCFWINWGCLFHFTEMFFFTNPWGLEVVDVNFVGNTPVSLEANYMQWLIHLNHISARLLVPGLFWLVRSSDHDEPYVFLPLTCWESLLLTQGSYSQTLVQRLFILSCGPFT